MATLTKEQIEAKKLRLKQLAEEAKALRDELIEAGELELSEDDLDNAAGGQIGSLWIGDGPYQTDIPSDLSTPPLDYLNLG